MENLWNEDNKWCTYWLCEECNTRIKCCANQIKYLKRNVKNKKICKSCSLKNQKGVNNPFYGKKHTEETIKKISKNRLGIRTSDHMSKPEYKELFSKLAKERWNSEGNEKARKHMSDIMKKRIANGEIKGYNRSKAEDELIKILNSSNIQVIPNFKIESKIYDLYIPKYNLIIEYNGDYWHANPSKYNSKYFNVKKQKTAKEIWEYDKDKLDLAINHNYSYEVIWESDYKKNKKIILEVIKKYEK